MEDKVQVLQRVPVLATLGEELMKGLAEEAELVAIKKGDLVVREDDPGDALYVVVSGRLQAYTRLSSGAERIFASYSNGDCFGEMPLLSGETHWANVRALNDSVLLKIPRAVFDKVVSRDPRVAVGLSQRMGQRIKQLRAERHRAKQSTLIALYSALPGAGKSLLAGNLVATLARETGEPVLLLDFSGKQPSTPLARCERLAYHAGATLPDPVARTAYGYDRLNLALGREEGEARLIAPLFVQLTRHYDYVLVDLPNETSAPVMACLTQSDQIYVVTRNEDAHLYRTRLLLEDLRRQPAAVAPKARVILTAVCEECAPVVDNVAQKIGQPVAFLLRWIPEEQLAGVEPYVLRQPMAAYSFVVRRIGRGLSNRLVGLALSAGGARGLAHIGVIRVLEREGIAVDMVAGSSMGALISAAWAVGKSADEMEAIAKSVKSKRVFLKLLDPMFPGAGIFRGMRVWNFLRGIVDDLTFDDTIIPLRVVATDLNTTEKVVFGEGKLVDAIRASVSIPGVFRPVINNGHTLIDGGIADPVPVNVLAQAGVARIIAVNTIPNRDHLHERDRYRCEVLRAPRKHRRGILRETGPVIETPGTIIDIYMRSMHAMQSHIAEEACANADVVLRPLRPDAVWYDFYNPEPYIACGEQAAEAALPRLKELVRA
jgi:NTE family protein